MSNLAITASDRIERKAAIKARLERAATLSRIEAREVRIEVETLTLHPESYEVRERHYKLHSQWASYCQTCKVTLASGQVATHRGFGHTVN